MYVLVSKPIMVYIHIYQKPTISSSSYQGGLLGTTPSLFKIPCSTTVLALTTHPSSSGMPVYANDPHIQIPGPPSELPLPAPCSLPSLLLPWPAVCHHRLPTSTCRSFSALFDFTVRTARSSFATLSILPSLGGIIGFVVWNTAGRCDGNPLGRGMMCVAIV